MWTHRSIATGWSQLRPGVSGSAPPPPSENTVVASGDGAQSATQAGPVSHPTFTESKITIPQCLRQHTALHQHHRRHCTRVLTHARRCAAPAPATHCFLAALLPLRGKTVRLDLYSPRRSTFTFSDSSQRLRRR